MTTEPARPPQRVRCLIPLPDAVPARVLVVPPASGAGGWDLPEAEFPPGWWFAEALAPVTDHVRSRFGLHATVLRHLQDGGPAGGGTHLCELEGRDPDWRPPAPAAWATLGSEEHVLTRPPS